jgi:anti-sigma factor RsiW
MTELSDELLMAYIDGQLDRPQASVVGHMLSRDGELARRVRRMQESQAKFLALFGALVREGAAANPTRSGSRSARQDQGYSDPSGFVTAGVATLLVVFGASLGFTTAYYSGMSRETSASAAEVQMPPADWTQDIAELHAFFPAETLTAGRDSQANPDVVKFQLAKLSSHATVLPDFSQHGLRFVRAQMLSYRGNKLMQIVYSGKSDPLVALYITPGDGELAVSPGRFGDVKTVSWGRDGLRYLIAADMTHEALRALAAVAQSQSAKD